jgi:hypothetical protein
VLDTQMLIAIKKNLGPADQWDLLVRLAELVQAGYVTYPRQVVRELAIARHPDGPGIMAIGEARSRCYPEPSDDSLATVLGVAPGLFDPNEERNQADPYVIALAWELDDRYPSTRVVVATENTVDRGSLQSPGTACELLGLERLDWQGFLDWVDALDDV